MATDIITTTFNLQSGSVNVEGFGTALIFTTDTPATGITFNKGTGKLYTGADAVGLDWGTSSDTYLAAQALRSADSKVSKFRVWRRADAVSIVKTLTFSRDFVAADEITVTVNGIELDPITYASSHSATATALASEIQSGEGLLTCTVVGRVFTITADPNYPLNLDVSVEVASVAITTTQATTTAGHTIADDFVSAKASINDFYWLADADHDKGNALVLAAAVESDKKIFGIGSNEAGIKATTGTDLFALLNAGAYKRTFGIFSETASQYPELRWIGRCVPKNNGQTQFALKTLSGQTVDDLSEDSKTNIEAKNGNYYIEQSGVNITYTGIMFDGSPIEQRWDLDYAEARLQESMFALLVQNEKIPMTQNGINQVGSVLTTWVNQMVDEGILSANDPITGTPPSVYIPKISEISTANRQNRNMAGFVVSGYYVRGTIKIAITVNVAI